MKATGKSRSLKISLPLLLLILPTAVSVTQCSREDGAAHVGQQPARVVSLEPADGSRDVLTSTIVKVNFSRELDEETASAFELGLFLQTETGDEEVAVQQTLLRDRRTLVLNPLEDLAPGASYALSGKDEIPKKTENAGNPPLRVLVRFRTAVHSQNVTTIHYDPFDLERIKPYPSDLLCEHDPTSTTGLRLRVPEDRVPWNVRPDELARADGFSPHPRIMVTLTGPIETGLLPSAHTETADPTSPVLLMNVDTESSEYGERIPFLVDWKPYKEKRSAPEYTLLFSPVQPLRPATRYALVVTRRLADPNRRPVEPSTAFQLFLKGEEISSPKRAHEVLDPVLAFLRSDACELPMLTKDLALVLPFTTRSRENLTGDLLAIRDYLFDSAEQSPPEIVVTSVTSLPPREDIPCAHIGRFIKGTVECPDFRGENGLFDMDLIHQRPWDAPGIPLEFILTIPRGATEREPAGVVIFLHGINDQKEKVYVIADAFAREGLAAIAIDIVEHGTRNSLPGLVPWIPFINPNDLAVCRDNMRQTQSDLLNLTRAVQTGLTAAIGEQTLNTESLGFFGTSLGGILGIAYLALEPSVTGAVLSVTGGSFTEIALHNPLIQPDTTVFKLLYFILGLISETPTEALYWGLSVMQDLLDPADPLFYAPYVNRKALAQPFTRKDLVLLEAMEDNIIANRSTENLARAFGMDLVMPVKREVAGLVPREDPVAGNGPAGNTAGLCQFDWITLAGERVEVEHSSLLLSAEAHQVAAHFLSTCLYEGRAEILSPYP